MILLTGGSGFIGSNLLEKLNKIGRTDVIVVDNINSKEKSNNLSGLNYSYNINKNYLWKWIQENQPELSLIIHLGACTDTTELDKKYLKNNNIDYSKRLFEIAVKSNIPFIYASSAATYGDGSNGFSDKHSKLNNLEPLNEYGRSKHYFDRWLIIQKNKPKHWVGLKFFNVYGPNEKHKKDMASAVFKFIKKAKKNNLIKIFEGSHGYSKGEQKRDFIFVDDVIEIIMWFSFSKIKNGIYNVGTGNTTTFNNIAKCISRIKKDVNIIHIDFPNHLYDIYQAYTKADIKKLKSSGFKHNFISIDRGIKKMIEIYFD